MAKVEMIGKKFGRLEEKYYKNWSYENSTKEVI